MTLLFKIVWACWFTSEILLNRIYKTKDNQEKDWDKNSLLIIWITISVSIALGVFATNKTEAPITKTSLSNYTGLVLIILGIVIRLIAIRTLGKFFTVNLNLAEDHLLIKNGLYKFIRHPSYTGSLMSFFGFGLSLNNWLSLVIIFIPVLFVFIYRINIEEKLMTEQFGKEYDEYKKQTKRLIPCVY
jgi:protein-S-isoprenylcysteine O-methyltransferase Ste14